MKSQTIHTDISDQYLLRVRRGTALDKIMRAMRSSDTPLTNEQLAQIGGQSQWKYMFNWIMKMMDNVTVNKDWKANAQSISYTHPVTIAVQPVGVDIKPSKATIDATDAGIDPEAEQSILRWPQMPPLCQKQDFFVEPPFYQTMKKMVARGKHISLAGPPSVGKDTAVIELAAEMGKPLVTIGGDAGFRRRDLTGSTHIANGSSFVEVGEYVTAAINGWWVLLTEVNAADADALIYINSQLAAPYVVTLQGKAYPVHEDFRIFISYNPGLVGTKPLPQSFKDRFFSIQVPFFTHSQLKTRLEAHGMPKVEDAPWADNVVRFGIAMWEAHNDQGKLRYQITTRRLTDAVTLMEEGYSDIKTALKDAVLSAIDSPVEYQTAMRILQEVCRG